MPRETYQLGGHRHEIDAPTGDGLAAVRAVWGNEVYPEGSVGTYHYRRSFDDPESPLAEAWMGRNFQWYLRIKKRTNKELS